MSNSRVEKHWFDKWINEAECTSLSGDLGVDDMYAAFQRGVLLGRWLELAGKDGGGWPGTDRHREFAEFSEKHGFCFISFKDPRESHDPRAR